MALQSRAARLTWVCSMTLLLAALAATAAAGQASPSLAPPPAGAEPLEVEPTPGAPVAPWPPPAPFELEAGRSSAPASRRPPAPLRTPLRPLQAGQTPRAPVSRLPPLDVLDRAVDAPVRARAAPSDPCEPQASDVASGPALVAYLRSAPDITCMNVLFTGPEDLRRTAFRRAHVVHVLRTIVELTAAYDGSNSTNLLQLYHFLRAAYFNEFYEDYVDLSSPEVDRLMVQALDAFFQNDHYRDITDAHGEVLDEVFVVLDNFDRQRGRFLPVVKDWFARFDARHAEHRNLLKATNRLFFWLFRGHWHADFHDAALSDTELIDALRDLALSDSLLDNARHADFVEVILANAALETARFLAPPPDPADQARYDSAPIQPAVEDAVRRILARYDPFGRGASIWMAAARLIPSDKCDAVGACGARERVEGAILSIEYACGESVRFRVQSMTPAQLQRACGKLNSLDTYFHEQLATGRRPVAGDFNSTLEVIVYKDYDNYDLYSGFLFGNETNNGGIYLEGDPSNPENTARFFAHLATWLPDEPVWNLEHEYVHYLDGRYNLVGDFGDYRIDTHKTVWWAEGLAEYISHRGRGKSIIEYSESETPPLSEIFGYRYGDPELYPRTHLAMSFMFAASRQDIDCFLGFFRAGSYDAYLKYLNRIGTAYDDAWRSWIGNGAANLPARPACNRPPQVETQLPDRTLEVGASVTVDLAGAFRDPEGDALTWGASSSLPSTVAVTVAGSTLTVASVAGGGSAEVTVSATDRGGSNVAATQTFRVTVVYPNGPPEAVGTLAPLTLSVDGGLYTLQVAGAFRDPEGDPLTYAASSSAPSVAAVSMSGSLLDVRPVSAGAAEVTVSATDAGGSNLSATQAFRVTVRRPFTDHPLVPGETPIKAVHFTELRSRIDALRAAAGLGAFAWTDPVLTPGVTPVRAVHLRELRTALGAAYAAAGRPAPPWTDAAVPPGAVPIRAAHVMELRAAVAALE